MLYACMLYDDVSLLYPVLILISISNCTALAISVSLSLLQLQTARYCERKRGYNIYIYIIQYYKVVLALALVVYSRIGKAGDKRMVSLSSGFMSCFSRCLRVNKSKSEGKWGIYFVIFQNKDTNGRSASLTASAEEFSGSKKAIIASG